jgi:two-component system nitrate/nitrite response regulator NarL
MSRIFLLLNDPLVAGRMRTIINAAAGLEVVGWVNTLAQARQQLGSAKAALVLADLQLADGWLSGFLPELTGNSRHGRPKVLAAALSLDDSQLLEALCHGADGYFLQGRSSEALILTIQQALAGEATMAPEIARQVKAHFDGLDWDPTDFVGESLNSLHPSDTERLLLQWAVDGYLPHEIARHLKITPSEVGRRIRMLYRKLQYDLRAGSLSLAA